MRFVCALLAVLAVHAGPGFASQPSPYAVTVLSNRAPLRCDASAEHEPVASLPRGASLDVYQQQGDWLAVRPPEGSFSWVAAEQLEPTDHAGIYRVKDDDTVSWIGHEGSQVRACWQVKLNKGEHVRVVELDEQAKWSQTPQGWIKIAPPAGEFRWLHRRHLQSPQQEAAQRQAAQPAAQQPGNGSPSAESHVKMHNAPLAAPQVPPASWTPRQDEKNAGPAQAQTTPTKSPASSQASPPAVVVANVATPHVSLANFAASSNRVAVPPRDNANHTPKASASEVSATANAGHASAQAATTATIDAQLSAIELQLAIAASQPPATWNLPPVMAHLQALNTSAPTPMQRGKAQLLLEKSHELLQIQQGYAQLAQPSPAAPQLAAPQLAAPQLAAPQPAGSQLAGSQLAVAQSTSAAQPVVSPAAYSAPIARYPGAISSGMPAARSSGAAAGSGGAIMSQLRKVAHDLSRLTGGKDQHAPRPNQPAVAAASFTQPASGAIQAAPAVYQAPAAGDAPQFDGTGWLMPLVARSKMPLDSRSGIPPFALTDDRGNVLQLITPSPGLNLSQFVRQQVGIYGQPGALPNLTTPHIVAQRVVVLDRHQ